MKQSNISHDKALIIGLTGGIGSGKTAASDRFAEHGICVVDADVVARKVVEPDTLALEQIKEHFGPSVLNEDGTLNRAVLRELIFSDNEQRLWLERLLHPIIRDSIVQQLANSQSDYSVLVSPLLIESKQDELVDRVLVVDVPEEIQIRRASSRDSNSEEQIRAIMEAQLSREKRLQAADDVVSNAGNLAALHADVDRVHNIYLELVRNQLVSNTSRQGPEHTP